MLLSIIIPTHRDSYAALARVLDMATLDPGKFEVIVRDNSGNPEKHAFLDSLKSPVLKIHKVPNQGGFENSIAALDLAQGEFVQFLADDDWISAHGLAQMHALGEKAESDPTVAGLTGDFLLETPSTTGFISYAGLDAEAPATRLAGYLAPNGPNVLYYGAFRRSVLKLAFRFMADLPFQFSFADQMVCALYTALGRILPVGRVVYYYDLGPWETSEGSVNKDRAAYAAAGLPAEIDRLHWLICALEGGLLLRSRMLSTRIQVDPATLVAQWFPFQFERFRRHDREAGLAMTPFGVATANLRRKWLAMERVSLDELLMDLCNVFEIANPAGARRYFDFWSTL